MSKDDDIMSMYEELINSGKLGTPDQMMPFGNRKQFDPDEAEVFVTSTDKEKMREEASPDSKKPLRGRAGKSEEEFVFKSYAKKREHRYTEKEMAEIMESCKFTIVHDYAENDFYHISDEDRAKHDRLADISMKLGSVKRVYRRIDEYIKAMRIVYEAWDILSKTNMLYSREEFFDRIASGHIVSHRIIMPKLKGYKDFSIDKLVQYVSDHSLDPSDLMPIVDDDEDVYLTDEEYSDKQLRLLSEEELEHIANFDPATANPIKLTKAPNKYLKMHSSQNKKAYRKKLKKSDREIADDYAELLKRLDRRQRGSGNYYYGLTESSLGGKKERSVYDRIRYDGSWSDDTAVAMYELVMDDEIMHEPLSDYGTVATMADMSQRKFFELLERHGVNVMELRRAVNAGMGEEEQSNSSIRKQNRKIENRLLERIHKLSRDPKFKKLIAKTERKLESGNK